MSRRPTLQGLAGLAPFATARPGGRGCYTASMSDTAQIILAVIGTGVALLGVLVAFRQEVRADISALRQEMRTDIASLNARIDALFCHKDPAA